MSQMLTRRRRPLVLALLAVGAVTIAVPLALGVLDVASAGDRRLLAPSGGVLWAVALLGLLVAAIVGLVAWPGRALRRGALLGGVLAGLVFASAAAWQATGPQIPSIPTCHAEPRIERLVAVRASTYVDGVERDAIVGRNYATAGTRLASLFDELPLGAAEDLGIERLEVGGVALAARHCRALVSGSHVTAAVPELTEASLSTDAPLVPAELPIWRGDFDWWVSAQGELVRAEFKVGGHPADAWPVDGLRGELQVVLWPAWMVDQ